MIQKLIPRCIKGNLATNVCISKACYELNPFVCVYCNNQSCKKIHSKCQIIKWGDLKKKMEQQIKVRGLKLLNFIDRVENVFKTLKDLYESEYNSYRQWIQQLSLSQQKKQCYQKISVKRWNDITGSMLAEFYDNDDKEYQYVKSVNEKYFEQRRVELLNKLEHIRVEIPNMYKEAIIEQKKVKNNKKDHCQSISQSKHNYKYQRRTCYPRTVIKYHIQIKPITKSVDRGTQKESIETQLIDYQGCTYILQCSVYEMDQLSRDSYFIVEQYSAYYKKSMRKTKLENLTIHHVQLEESNRSNYRNIQVQSIVI